MNRYPYLLVLFVFLGACVERPQEQAREFVGVQSLVWTQRSAEIDALYYQAYNVASMNLKNYEQKGDKGPAVTLDLDETVLDNSPFNVNMLSKDLDYSEELWAEWCELRDAEALPGALEFTLLAKSMGVEVFYVSNRAASLLDATLDNLIELGFPNADTTHVLLKTESSSKDARRDKIRENYNIIMLLGDNLGDFDGLFDDRDIEMGKASVREHKEAFGNSFIIFPNVMYGSWQRAAFPEGTPGAEEMLKSLRGID